jgi:hypothetical protein
MLFKKYKLNIFNFSFHYENNIASNISKFKSDNIIFFEWWIIFNDKSEKFINISLAPHQEM